MYVVLIDLCWVASYACDYCENISFTVSYKCMESIIAMIHLVLHNHWSKSLLEDVVNQGYILHKM